MGTCLALRWGRFQTVAQISPFGDGTVINFRAGVWQDWTTVSRSDGRQSAGCDMGKPLRHRNLGRSENDQPGMVQRWATVCPVACDRKTDRFRPKSGSHLPSATHFFNRLLTPTIICCPKLPRAFTAESRRDGHKPALPRVCFGLQFGWNSLLFKGPDRIAAGRLNSCESGYRIRA